MNLPFTAPPPTVTYRVSINGEEPNEYLSPAKASKYVADNIKYRNEAEIEFLNAGDVDTVRSAFQKRIDDWLRNQLNHSDGFHCVDRDNGLYCRLSE